MNAPSTQTKAANDFFKKIQTNQRGQKTQTTESNADETLAICRARQTGPEAAVEDLPPRRNRTPRRGPNWMMRIFVNVRVLDLNTI